MTQADKHFSLRSPLLSPASPASSLGFGLLLGAQQHEEAMGHEEAIGHEFDGGRAAEVVAGLRQGFGSGRTRTYQWRAVQLKAIARMIDEKEEDIAAAIYDDLAKPRMESFLHEIIVAKEACLFALKNMKRWMKPKKVGTAILTFPSSAKTVPEPLGVVLIISAWNFPFLLSIEPVIGAISAGNAVVLKPSEVAPATSSFFAKFLPDYVDNSCIRVVEGSVPETIALLEQKWDKILYTGNGRIGRAVMAAASKHLTPVVLELGGKCPVVVDSDVDINIVAKRIAAGKWGCNNGQACIAPDYIITTKSFAPKLLDALKVTLEKFYGKDPLGSPDLSHIVNSKHFMRLINLLDDVSGSIVYGGQKDEKHLKIAPTLLLDVPHDSSMMEEEIFGPFLPIVTVDDLEQSFDILNSKEKPLAAYLFTKNKNIEQKFVNTVSAGGMLINDTILHFTNPRLPFGGVGESGIGSYHGKFSFDAFSHKKPVLRRNFNFIGEIPMRYPPYTPQKQTVLTGLMTGNVIPFVLALIKWPKGRQHHKA
ncbi:aldehyde dehydrogenase family 3 member H1-like [Canna indica]|uniref:Aldehyde dehydrogenase n=1 Tax=Canna indica TaxID=4628 RepID=A0AAQ3K400_9LILI|nr:aldehyde dehydrogenase family 3 member H1-like [Canna indica]